MAQGQRLAGRPDRTAQTRAGARTRQSEGLALSAAAAAERNDFDGAIALYKRLKGMRDSQQRGVARGRPGARGTRSGAQGCTAPVAAAAPPSAKAPPTVAAAPPNATAPSPPASGAGPGVEGRVEVDPKLAAKIAPGDALFIYARDPEGTRMPLAILRGTAADLPKSFALTDAMAMTPANDDFARQERSSSRRAFPSRATRRRSPATCAARRRP